MAHVHEPPPPFAVANPNVQLSPSLEALVMRCLSKSADDRFASMDEVLVAMKNVTTESGNALLGASDVRPSLSTGTTGQFAAQAGGISTPPPSSLPGVALSQSQSGPGVAAVAQDHVSTLPPPGPRNALIAGGVVVLLLVAVGGGWMMLGGSGPAPTTARSTATTETTPPSTAGTETVPTPPPELPPAPLSTTVTLSSEPAGATVRVGDVAYGPTPAEITWTGDDAAREREVTFVFELEGYRPMTIVRRIGGETLDVSATLDRLPAARPIRPRPPRPSGDPEDDSAPVGPIHGYKTDPY
jgi:serine/threonine-protein kinase